MTGAAAGASTIRSKSQPKKSTEVDKADEPKGTGSEAEEEADNKQKSRSTSRGMFNKLKGKKEEKAEEKKEEHEEKKAEKEEAKVEKEVEKSVEAAAVGAAAPLDAPSTGTFVRGTAWWSDADVCTAERVIGAPVEDQQEPAAESGAVVKEEAPITKSEEKAAKQNKRSSIFGRMSSGFSGFKSPSKEKAEKDAELKPEVPAKDTTVSETAPQIPEPATETTETPTVTSTEPESKEEGKPAEAAKEKLDEVSPQQKGFLSGLPFMNKRNRSVSPSTNMKEAPKKEEGPVKEEASPVEPAAVAAPEEATKPAEVPATTETTTDKPTEKVEEPTSTPNKRSSVFGNLGRRASKAFKGMQSPVKKENTAPTAAETKSEEATETVAAEDKPIVNGESKAAEPSEQKPDQTIGDVVPGAVDAGQPQHQATPTVTASA